MDVGGSKVAVFFFGSILYIYIHTVIVYLHLYI